MDAGLKTKLTLGFFFALLALAPLLTNPLLAHANEERPKVVKARWTDAEKEKASSDIPDVPPREEDLFTAGFAFGEPLGISFQMAPANETMAVNGLAAYSILNEWLQFSFDFVFQQGYGLRRFMKTEKRVDTYYGIGILAAFDQKEAAPNQKAEDDFILGMRLPVGVEWLSQSKKFQWYIELSPGVQVLSEFDFLIQGGLGVRYLF